MAGQTESAKKRPRVFADSYPLAFFAERIGGDAVEVIFLVPRDQDPAYWEPDEDSLAAFQSADLVLLNGADYAKWTLRASLPWSRTVVTTRDVEDQYIEVPNAVTHSHGPEGEHSHAGLASETWIDPQLALSQAGVVRDELQKLLPDSVDAINSGFKKLRDELRSLDTQLKAVFAESNIPWTASYPAYRYLGRRYEVPLDTMNWEPSELPSDDQWAEFDKLRNGAESSFMLWTAKPGPQIHARLTERGIRVVVFRLATHRQESGDYLSVMRQNLLDLQKAVSASPQE